MLTISRGAQAYHKVQVESQSPLENVVALYDGMLRFLHAALDAAVAGNHDARREALSRALAIACELQAVLNMDAGGGVAQSLDQLYAHLITSIVAANREGSAPAIEACIDLVRPVRDAWAQAAAPHAAAREGERA